jgi:hypothetical protein
MRSTRGIIFGNGAAEDCALAKGAISGIDNDLVHTHGRLGKNSRLDYLGMLLITQEHGRDQHAGYSGGHGTENLEDGQKTTS